MKAKAQRWRMNWDFSRWRTIWSAVAERSGDTAFGREQHVNPEAVSRRQSGVALRFPPQSKTLFTAHGEGAQRLESHAGRCRHRDIVVLRLIRQRHKAVCVLLGKMQEASAHHRNANRLGGAMKCNLHEVDREIRPSPVGAEYAALHGAWGFLVGGFYKDVAPDGAEVGARETAGVTRRLVAPKCDESESPAQAEAVGILSLDAARPSSERSQ